MLTVGCDSRPEWIDQQLNEDAYQIFQLVSGTGFVLLGSTLSMLTSGDLVFMKPGNVVVWSLSQTATLHYCQVTPDFLAQHPHVVRQFKQDPVFNIRQVISQVQQGQAATIGMLFRMMRQEWRGVHEDRKEAILIHLQLLLLLAHRT